MSEGIDGVGISEVHEDWRAKKAEWDHFGVTGGPLIEGINGVGEVRADWGAKKTALNRAG